MEMKIDAARWLAAQKASEWRRSQIQGFFYTNGGRDSQEGYHVIRDVWKDPGAQKLWEEWGDADTYDAAHARMMAEIELHQTQIICDYYREGWAEPAEEDTPTPADAGAGEREAE